VRIGRFTISQELLIDALNLPNGVRIVNAATGNNGEILLTVKHHDLPDVGMGEPTALKPIFLQQRPIVMKDWGLP